MRTVISAVVLTGVALLTVGCGSEGKSSAEAQAEHAATASPEAFDEGDLKREAFDSALDSMAPGVKVDICKAAESGGVQGIKDFMRSEDYPYEVEDLDYDAKHLNDYCKSK